MASNDSGVDTSNDSNDSVPVPPILDLAHVFAHQLEKGFVSPQKPSAKNSTKQCSVWRIRRERVHSRLYGTKFGNESTLPYIQIRHERKLRLAASTCNIELLTKLLDFGIDPNCSDEHKRSPLHLAACRGYTDIVIQLLKYGANPNIVDSVGNTPLHLAIISACSHNFNLVVRILLKGGANPLAKDRSGKNSLQLAQSRLKLLRTQYKNPTCEKAKLLEDMYYLTLHLFVFSCKSKTAEDTDLDGLEKCMQNLSTVDQVVSETDNLLDSVQKLSLTN